MGYITVLTRKINWNILWKKYGNILTFQTDAKRNRRQDTLVKWDAEFRLIWENNLIRILIQHKILWRKWPQRMLIWKYGKFWIFKEVGVHDNILNESLIPVLISWKYHGFLGLIWRAIPLLKENVDVKVLEGRNFHQFDSS